MDKELFHLQLLTTSCLPLFRIQADLLLPKRLLLLTDNISCLQLEMARRYLPVNQIVEGIKGWTVLVQVIERGHVQVSRGARPINYRRFLLTDSEGTKVSAVIYGNDIRYFAGMLLPFRRYYISSASLRKSDLKYRVSDYPHSWVIHNRTLIEEYAEQAPPPIPCHIDLTEFKNLFRFADTENLQNVMAVVVHAFPPKEQGLDSTTRDFVLINEE